MSGLNALLEAEGTAAATAALHAGLPNKRTEAWKYVPTRTLERTLWGQAPAKVIDGFGISQGHLINPPKVDGLRISQEPLSADETARLAALASRHGFQASAQALAGAPWILSVAPGAQVHLDLTHFSNAADTAGFAICVLRVGANAQLSLTERFESTDTPVRALAGCTILATLDRDAQLRQTRLQTANPGAHVFMAQQVSVGENAGFQHFVTDFGGQLSRLDLTVDLTGRGAEATCNGLAVTTDQQYHDVHLDVNHVVGQTHSAMTYRTMVDGRGEATLNGRVYMAKDAQRSATEQSIANLLLSPTSRVNPKPELEIYADDVTASHGCTVGSLDATELFYLRSRGLSAADARAFLQYAFAERVIELLTDDAARADIEHRLLGELKHGELIRELQDSIDV